MIAESLFCKIMNRFFSSSSNMAKGRIQELGFLPSPPSTSTQYPALSVPLCARFESQIMTVLPSLMPSKDFDAKREVIRASLQVTVRATGVVPPGTQVALFGSSMNNFGKDDAGDCTSTLHHTCGCDINDARLMTLVTVTDRSCDTSSAYFTPCLALPCLITPCLASSCPTLLCLTLSYLAFSYLTITSTDTDMDMTLILPDGGSIPPEDKSKAVISYVTIHYCIVLCCGVVWCAELEWTGLRRSLVDLLFCIELHANVFLPSYPPSFTSSLSNTHSLTPPLHYLLTDSVQRSKSYQV